MLDDSWADPFFERNEAAKLLIDKSAHQHALIDGIVDGLASFVPFAGPVALAGQLVWQTKSVYPKLIQELAVLYTAEPDSVPGRIVGESTLLEGAGNLLFSALEEGLLGEISQEISNEILNAFGQDFLTDLIKDALTDNIPGLLGGSIPVIGGPISATLAAGLAYLLTWRVGLNVCVYFLNGREFPGSREYTANVIKQELIPRKIQRVGPDIFEKVDVAFPVIGEKRNRRLTARVERYRVKGLADAQIRDVLEADGYSDPDIADALA